jgi:predicted lysophospholipase L1 biosynthesis ABC-type transport system permease subunit
MKKLGIGSYLNIAAAVFGIAAVVLAVVSNGFPDKELPSLTACIIFGVIGVALCAAALVMANKDLIATVCSLGAIASFMTILNNIIGDRVIMIAGLFSFSAGDTVGWTVFYITVAAAVCIVLACVSVIAGNFLKK